MQFLTDQLTLLGLKKGEVRVFTVLATFGRMNMTTLARRSGLPRTTVDYMVRGMVERGLVVRDQIGGHGEYSVPLAKVASELDRLERKLVVYPLDKKNDEKVDINVENLCPSIGSSFAAHRAERVTLFLARLATDTIRSRHLEQYFSFAREHQVKLDLLTTRDVAEGLSLYATELLALVSCLELRLHMLPTTFCIENVDVITFRDEVLIISPDTLSKERVSDFMSVEVMKHLLIIARETAWSVDFDLYLRGRIEGIKKA